MERRTRVNWQGKEVDAVELPFQAAGEHWNEYLVNDGSVIKLKTITTQVFRLEGHYDNDGNPIYLIKSTNILAVSAHEKLKRKDAEG